MEYNSWEHRLYTFKTPPPHPSIAYCKICTIMYNCTVCIIFCLRNLIVFTVAPFIRQAIFALQCVHLHEIRGSWKSQKAKPNTSSTTSTFTSLGLSSIFTAFTLCVTSSTSVPLNLLSNTHTVVLSERYTRYIIIKQCDVLCIPRAHTLLSKSWL